MTKFGDKVDFSKSKAYNQDRYLSIGQARELLSLPDDERSRIINEKLNDQHKADIEDFKLSSQKLIQNIDSRFNIPSRSDKVLHDFNFALPPNYEAEKIRLLRQLVHEPKHDAGTKGYSRTVGITYTKTRQIILDDLYQLAQPTFNGTNDLVFDFLYKHPNETYTKKQLESHLNITITKPLRKIVENIGFTGDLSKAFFSVSKDSIAFKNPVSRDELQAMGIAYIVLPKAS